MSLTSTASSSGSSRDSRGAMEEPSGPEALAENGAAGSSRGRHPPNNNNSSSWLNKKGPLSPFNSRAASAPAHKLSYLGRVVREIVETERMYVQDLRSIVEVSEARGASELRSGGRLLMSSPGWPGLGGPFLSHKPTSASEGKFSMTPLFPKVCFPWSSGDASRPPSWGSRRQLTVPNDSGSDRSLGPAELPADSWGVGPLTRGAGGLLCSVETEGGEETGP